VAAASYALSMSSPTLVLDSNVYGFEPVGALMGLANRGFILRLSEVAFYERLAASFRDHVVKHASIAATYDDFIRRAQTVAPCLDLLAPIALGGANLTRRIAALADGRPPNEPGEHFHASLLALWRRIVAGDMSNEHWHTAGKMAGEMVDNWDAQHFAICQDAEVQIGEVQWKHVPEDGLRAELRSIAGDFSVDTAERLDAQLCSVSYRVHQAKWGARRPKKNDGADLSLPIHIGEGCFLLTRDQKLIDLIDESRTYQRAWVRRPDDLDALPADGSPWGQYAREVNRSFSRRN
jgi:hypothetical protein